MILSSQYLLDLLASAPGCPYLASGAFHKRTKLGGGFVSKVHHVLSEASRRTG
jgi:hypothetical protein